jgi:hypothetical protein
LTANDHAYRTFVPVSLPDSSADARTTQYRHGCCVGSGRIYRGLVFVGFVAAFVVGLAVAFLSVWIVGGQMGEIEGTGKYVAIIVSLLCAGVAYAVLRQAFKFKPEK